MSEVLRDVGPADVDSAGDMVGKVGVHNQAKRLITAVRANYPREMVAALSRPVDGGRSKYLDEEEVERLVEDTGWEDVVEVEGARVYGKGKNAVVGIVFRTESGRSARGAIPYSEFEESAAAYEAAIAEGGVVVTDEEDPRQLQRALDAAEKQIKELKENPESPEPEEPEEPYEGYADANGDDVAARLPEFSLAELIAVREAEEAGKARKGVLEPLAERLETAEAALRGEAETPDDG